MKRAYTYWIVILLAVFVVIYSIGKFKDRNRGGNHPMADRQGSLAGSLAEFRLMTRNIRQRNIERFKQLLTETRDPCLRDCIRDYINQIPWVEVEEESGEYTRSMQVEKSINKALEVCVKRCENESTNP